MPRRGVPDATGETKPPMIVQFPHYGLQMGPQAVVTDPFASPDEVKVANVLRRGPYAGVWRLVKRLERGTHTQEAYVQRVMSFLGDGFTYTESPPPDAQLPMSICMMTSGP